MHNIKRNFDKFLPVVNSFFEKMTLKRHGRAPKLTDAEVMTLSLVSGSLGIDSENHFFMKLKSEYMDDFPNLIERSRFNGHRRLDTPMRANQHIFKKQPFLFRKTRKRIETMFSHLCDQFMIRRNYAKSFDRIVTRIISKISAFTLLQYINKFYKQ